MSGLFRFSGKPGKQSYYVMGLCVAAMWVVLSSISSCHLISTVGACNREV